MDHGRIPYQQQAAGQMALEILDDPRPVVRKAYTKGVPIDREFLRKTSQLLQKHIGGTMETPGADYMGINRTTLDTIRQRDDGKATKVINLIKAIEKAEEKSDYPFLRAMADRAKAVQEALEARQDSTEKAVEHLFSALTKNEER